MLKSLTLNSPLVTREAFYRVHYKINDSPIIYKKIILAIDEKEAKSFFDIDMSKTNFGYIIVKIELARM